MKKFFLGLVALLFCTGCSVNPTQNNKVTIGLGYIENIQFAPFYVALEKGFFKEEGVDNIELVHGISPDLIMNVALGKFDFAMSDGDEIIKAHWQKTPIPVAPVFVLYKQLPVALVSLEETKLDSLEDIKGKIVGIPGEYGSSFDAFLIALMKAGLSRADFEIKSIGYTQIEQLLNQQIDVAVVFVNNEPVKLRAIGQKVNILPLSKYTDLVSATLLASNEKIQKDPQQVAGVKKALQKGMQFCLDNPQLAVDLAFDKGYIPNLSPNEKKYSLEVLQETIKLWGNASDFGQFDEPKWTKSIEEMRASGIIN